MSEETIKTEESGNPTKTIIFFRHSLPERYGLGKILEENVFKETHVERSVELKELADTERQIKTNLTGQRSRSGDEGEYNEIDQLGPTGFALTTLMARILQEKGFQPDIIMSGSVERTSNTLGTVMSVLAGERFGDETYIEAAKAIDIHVKSDKILPYQAEESIEETLAELSEKKHDDKNTVIIVGHEAGPKNLVSVVGEGSPFFHPEGVFIPHISSMAIVTVNADSWKDVTKENAESEKIEVVGEPTRISPQLELAKFIKNMDNLLKQNDIETKFDLDKFQGDLSGEDDFRAVMASSIYKDYDSLYNFAEAIYEVQRLVREEESLADIIGDFDKFNHTLDILRVATEIDTARDQAGPLGIASKIAAASVLNQQKVILGQGDGGSIEKRVFYDSLPLDRSTIDLTKISIEALIRGVKESPEFAARVKQDLDLAKDIINGHANSKGTKGGKVSSVLSELFNDDPEGMKAWAKDMENYPLTAMAKENAAKGLAGKIVRSGDSGLPGK